MTGDRLHHHDHDRHGHDACVHDAASACDHVHQPIDRTKLVSARALHVERAGQEILDGVDIDIAGGEIVTLIGPNGAGKTTLVRVLLGLERADDGEMFKAERLRIGYVPQRLELDRALPMTVARFLSLGTEADARRITASLAEVGAPHVAASQLSALSGGEVQRVFLARALLRQPDLLVLDEPVRGVDQAGEAELYRLIGRLRAERGFSVLLVSHDLHVVMAASDRVICLNRHVCCSGVPTTVARHPEYERLFGAATAPAFAVYEHHHDHAHDLTGAPVSSSDNPVQEGP